MKTLPYFALLLGAILASGAPADPKAPTLFRYELKVVDRFELRIQEAVEPTFFRYELKVVDTNGQPLPGAIVERYRGPDSPMNADWNPRVDERRTADANGTVMFTFTNQTMFTLVASKPGLSLGWATWYPRTGLEESAAEIMLTASMAVSGVVQDAVGKPIPDAPVWVSSAFRSGRHADDSPAFDLLNSPLGRQYLAARTGAGGKFRVEGLPTDATLDLAAAKPGLALDQPPQAWAGPESLNYYAGQSNVVLTLKPAATIEGRVVQEDTGAPVAGARVMRETIGFGGDTQPLPPTGLDGVFRLTDLSAGAYTLRGFVGTNQFPDWVCDTASVTVEGGATNRDVKITASRGGVLELTVSAESSGQPIKDASVWASRETMSESASTSGQGVARMRLAPGDYSLFVSKEGQRGHQAQITVERGQTNRLAITLESAPRLSGTVVDPDGKPAPRVKLSLFPFQQGGKQTDAEGRFTLTFDPNQFGGGQNFQRMLVARDLARNLAATLDMEEESTNANLRLEPAVTLTSRVTDAHGKAITNAQVQVMLRTERMSSLLGSPVHANAEGHFEIKGLPPGRRYNLDVSAKGFGRESRDLDAPPVGTRHVELDPFPLPLADQGIAGVVLDADDKPAPGTWVNSYGANQPSLNGRTDAKGRFAFDRICAGPIQLSANSPRGGGYGSVTAESGDTNIIIRLGVSQPSVASRASSKLKGTVVNPDGKPAPKVTVNLFPYNQGEKLTDAEGRFTLTSDPNQYSGMQINQRVVMARDLVRNLAAAVDVEEETTNADLRLEPALTLAGRVTDANGKPITNAQAQAMFWTERMGSSLGSAISADAEGRFEIRGLAPGRRYGVNVSAKGFGQDSRNVDAPDADTRRVELDPFELLVADQRIAGVVLDADDKPVAGAWINSYGDKQPNINGQTDAKGRFSFDKVCAGPIRLSANSSRGGYGNATAEGGDTNITLRISDSPGVRAQAPRPASLKGKPLPDLAPLGLTAADAPADRPLLALVIDAEQRPSRRALRLLGEQAATLKQKGVTVVVLQAGGMADDAFASWKQEAALPFPVGCLKGNPEKTRAAWGAAALPWLILTDKVHRVAAEGFALEELDAKLQALDK